MNGYLKQATAGQARTIGAFIDDTDFKTLENALTINNTDIVISINGGADTVKNSGGATAHGAGGIYTTTWDATDTATVGELSFSVKVAGALVVFGTYVVLEEAVYDALFAASAVGYVANAPVNVAQISGDSTAADNAESFFDGTGYAGTNNVIPTVTTLTNLPAITANWLTAAGIAADAITAAKIADGAIDAATFAAGAINAAAIAADAITDAKVAADVTIASVTGNVGGNVNGSVGSVVAAVAITSNIKQNQALANFEFLMTDSTNHAPATGLAVTVTRSIDGGAFAAGTLSAVTELSNGIYKVDFGAGDLNGKVITLRATAAASDDCFERIVTQV